MGRNITTMRGCFLCSANWGASTFRKWQLSRVAFCLVFVYGFRVQATIDSRLPIHAFPRCFPYIQFLPGMCCFKVDKINPRTLRIPCPSRPRANVLLHSAPHRNRPAMPLATLGQSITSPAITRLAVYLSSSAGYKVI